MRIYNARRGTTDSELFFLMLIQHGLEDCPNTACEQVIGIIEAKRKKHQISEPLRLALVFSNGNMLFGVRYASDKFSPTLYISGKLDNGGVSLSPEPLDGNPKNWETLEPTTMVEIDGDNTDIRRLSIGR